MPKYTAAKAHRRNNRTHTQHTHTHAHAQISLKVGHSRPVYAIHVLFSAHISCIYLNRTQTAGDELPVHFHARAEKLFPRTDQLQPSSPAPYLRTAQGSLLMDSISMLMRQPALTRPLLSAGTVHPKPQTARITSPNQGYWHLSSTRALLLKVLYRYWF